MLERNLNLKDFIKDVKKIRKPDKTEFPYNGIWLFSGSQGSGKTLFMINLLLDLVEKFPDVRIYSNINLFGIDYLPYTGLECFEDSNGKHGIIYVIDEIHTLYSNMQSKNCKDSNLVIWSQNRKNVRLILGTSQRFSRVAKPIREQTTYMVQCMKPVLSLFPYRIYDGEMFDDNGKYCPDMGLSFDKKQKICFPKLHLYVPKFKSFDSYDTKEVVRGDQFAKLDN